MAILDLDRTLTRGTYKFLSNDRWMYINRIGLDKNGIRLFKSTYKDRCINSFYPLEQEKNNALSEVRIMKLSNEMYNEKEYFGKIKSELWSRIDKSIRFALLNKQEELGRNWNKTLLEGKTEYTLFSNDGLRLLYWLRIWPKLGKWKIRNTSQLKKTWSNILISINCLEDIVYLEERFQEFGIEVIDWTMRYMALNSIAKKISTLLRHTDKRSVRRLCFKRTSIDLERYSIISQTYLFKRRRTCLYTQKIYLRDLGANVEHTERSGKIKGARGLSLILKIFYHDGHVFKRKK